MSVTHASIRVPVDAVAVFKALGHPARLEMVKALGAGELCVCELVKVAGLGWSSVSRHLAQLKEAGVVQDEKRGMQVYYSLTLPCVGGFIRCLETDDGKDDDSSCSCTQ
ncbi:MAG: winged helix-turn-helix transcriptional regulator [Opitutales bacterium]|nr:winged helix-turn-helix transcriptional regulator [Opitutales bacterium]